MSTIKICILYAALALALACGKKDWPQPIAAEEKLFIDHLEARRDGNCILLNVKLGGNLHNLEFFVIELEQGGCPTCPFVPTSTYTLQPFSKSVLRMENNFVLTLCPQLPDDPIRLRVSADNRLDIVDPGVSSVLTLDPITQ